LLSRPRVVGVGLACLDHLALWQDASMPVRDNRILEWTTQGGGPVATALVAVARLGGQAEVWAAVGTDWMADLVVQGLDAEGVDTTHIVRLEGRDGPLVVVCVDGLTGERQFLYSTGFFTIDDPFGPVDSLASAGCLLYDGMQYPSALRAAVEARRLGVPVVADLSGRVGEGRREILRYTDHAIASQYCLRSLDVGDDSRHGCEMIQAMGPRHVVVTLGGKGLASLDGNHYTELPAFDVEVVDTTGAGDVFHGAFCYGLVKGLTVEQNLRFASAVSALKCRRLGGRAGIPTCQEALEFLHRRGFHVPDAC
jgi:sulfofructose kinase